MSGLEIPAFLIGAAGLFSSCVDAFSYFKAAQRADEDIEILLLKLDIEKTRLLLWGNEIGMFSANQQHPRLRQQDTVELLERILDQIEKLLTDSETLRTSYGVRNLEETRAKAIDFLSSKSLAIFRTSASRFWTRNASRLGSGRQRGGEGLVARTKWAIYEGRRFQGLVNNVKHFVDNLYELVSVDRETQDSIIKADIETILDLSQLRLVEAATEDSYRAYSQIAASVIEASEFGTVDRRTVEERIRDIQSLQDQNQPIQIYDARDPSSNENSGLRSVLNSVHQLETVDSDNSALAKYLDRTWLERRLDHFEYEQPYHYRVDRDSHSIVLGEADYLAPLLQKAPGRIPKATEVWALKTTNYPVRSLSRQLLCTFIEKRRPMDQNRLRHVVGSKRASSSTIQEHKRQRVSAGSSNGNADDGGGADSENSEDRGEEGISDIITLNASPLSSPPAAFPISTPYSASRNPIHPYTLPNSHLPQTPTMTPYPCAHAHCIKHLTTRARRAQGGVLCIKHADDLYGSVRAMYNSWYKDIHDARGATPVDGEGMRRYWEDRRERVAALVAELERRG
ncbi:prion-inhibition and propagation-domain-containing protein [Massariosphaeria phaeospora]|uniref:Prion-inhibition and propagation-domain-containing protein n=1 Tax=Massariosphaeria phaeospora TaxID=100035 RepID=A0A7C8IEA0_9PLEO|nr:prion-inhibition and propagation-domain-containing protein [Massariosphaeria phaeospora]